MAIILPNGYKMQTTFFNDFAIADAFGITAIEDTFKQSFNEWKDNIVYITEMAIVMSNKSIAWYSKGNDIYSKMYTDYYHKIDEYVMNHFKGKDLEFYFKVTD